MWSSLFVTALVGLAPAASKPDLLQNPVDSAAAWIAPVPSALARGDFGPCAVTIDFDDLVGGNNTCNGAHIVAQYPGLLFDVPSGNCVVCANSFLGGLAPNNSDPNLAYVQQNTNVCSADSLPGTIDFTPPVTMVGTDYFTSLNSDFTIRGFDAIGIPIASITSVGTLQGPFLSGFAGIAATGPIIARVEILSRYVHLHPALQFRGRRPHLPDLPGMLGRRPEGAASGPQRTLVAELRPVFVSRVAGRTGE